MRIARLAAMVVAAAVVGLYLRLIGVGSPEKAFSFVVLVYFLGFTIAGALRRPRTRPVPWGRLIAVVPAYNENPELLHGAVRSLLNGTVVPDVIHVVDDGSANPLPPFMHPRVVWHRRENGGKHVAQATALLAELEHFDFVVTVDSDSVLDRHAVERCLRPMSDPRIMGVTGVVYALNRAENIITRVTDLHYVHSCLIVRNGLSATGDIFTASGALATWRAEVVMDNLEEYLARRVADDRHLTHFAQRRGRTAAVADAYVYTNVPNNVPDLFRQRIRWARDYYRCTVLDIRYLRGWSFWMRLTDFAFMCLAPLFALTAMMVFPFAQWQIPWVGVGLWIGFLYAQTSCYLFERHGVSPGQRLVSWAFLTPALYVFQLVVVGPAMIAALSNLRHGSWQTRDKPKSVPRGKVVLKSKRSDYLDSLRMAAILRVIVFHATGAWWMSYLFPSMGIMFALAGALMAASIAKSADRPEVAIWNRFRRLMPAVWGLAVFLVPVMMVMGWGQQDARPLTTPAVLAWIFPLSDPPSNDWAIPIAGVFWYIRTYLWLVLLSPALWFAFRRWPLLTTVAPLLLVPIGRQIGFSAWLSDVVINIGEYGPCWVLGFWYTTGRLQRLPALRAYPVALLSMAGALIWVHFYPPPTGVLQTSPMGQVLWSVGFILILFRFDPPMDWLRRIRPLSWLLDGMNGRAVTIYLWHQLAILTSVAILTRAQADRLGSVPLLYTMKFALSFLLIAFVCWTMGWVEDLTGPRSRGKRPPELRRHSAEVASALHPKPELDQTAIIPIQAGGAAAQPNDARLRAYT